MFSEEYSRYKNIIEENLISYLPEVNKYAFNLANAMKYSLDAGGKRLRPVLILAACEACGGDIAEALPFACAIEFIHTYSLIHDDHPSIDNDELRRGKPTNHTVFGDDMAILAGDGLLNSAVDVMMAEVIKDLTPAKAKAMQEIVSAAGTGGMIAGQTADVFMTGSQSRKGVLEKETEMLSDADQILEFIHRNKTGALIRAAVRAGAVLGGADDKILEAMTEYAESIGLVFQIVDDILDIVGDEAVLGKKVGADIALGKMTYPAVFGLDKSYRKAHEVTDKAVKALENTGLKADFLCKLAIDLSNRIS